MMVFYSCSELLHIPRHNSTLGRYCDSLQTSRWEFRLLPWPTSELSAMLPVVMLPVVLNRRHPWACHSPHQTRVRHVHCRPWSTCLRHFFPLQRHRSRRQWRCHRTLPKSRSTTMPVPHSLRTACRRTPSAASLQQLVLTMVPFTASRRSLRAVLITIALVSCICRKIVPHSNVSALKRQPILVALLLWCLVAWLILQITIGDYGVVDMLRLSGGWGWGWKRGCPLPEFYCRWLFCCDHWVNSVVHCMLILQQLSAQESLLTGKSGLVYLYDIMVCAGGCICACVRVFAILFPLLLSIPLHVAFCFLNLLALFFCVRWWRRRQHRCSFIVSCNL